MLDAALQWSDCSPTLRQLNVEALSSASPPILPHAACYRGHNHRSSRTGPIKCQFPRREQGSPGLHSGTMPGVSGSKNRLRSVNLDE